MSGIEKDFSLTSLVKLARNCNGLERDFSVVKSHEKLLYPEFCHHSKVIFVDPSNFSQTILDNAPPNAAIVFSSGIYDKSILIRKSLALYGPNRKVNPVTNPRDRIEEATFTTNVPNRILILVRTGDVNPLTINGLEFRDIMAGGHAIIHIAGRGDKRNIHIINNRFINNDGLALFTFLKGDAFGFQFNNNVIDITLKPNQPGLQPVGLNNSQINGNRISNTTHGGINADSFVNCQINNNVIDNIARQGIQLANSPNSNTEIKGNTITNSNIDEQPDKGGISIYPNSNNIRISNNLLANNFNGFSIRDKIQAVSPSIVLTNNKIFSNAGFGAVNKAKGGGILNAKKNFWGDITGPNHSSNPNGKGNPVDDNIDFIPWSLN